MQKSHNLIHVSGGGEEGGEGEDFYRLLTKDFTMSRYTVPKGDPYFLKANQ